MFNNTAVPTSWLDISTAAHGYPESYKLIPDDMVSGMGDSGFELRASLSAAHAGSGAAAGVYAFKESTASWQRLSDESLAIPMMNAGAPPMRTRLAWNDSANVTYLYHPATGLWGHNGSVWTQLSTKTSMCENTGFLAVDPDNPYSVWLGLEDGLWNLTISDSGTGLVVAAIHEIDLYATDGSLVQAVGPLDFYAGGELYVATPANVAGGNTTPSLFLVRDSGALVSEVSDINYRRAAIAPTCLKVLPDVIAGFDTKRRVMVGMQGNGFTVGTE